MEWGLNKTNHDVTLFSIHKMWDRIWDMMFDPCGVPGSTKT